MKKRSRVAKRIRSTVPQTFDPKSEERLPVKSDANRKRQSSSETSLLLYKQLNQVFDVLKVEFNTHVEGPDLVEKLEKQILKSSDPQKSEMSRQSIEVKFDDAAARRDEVLKKMELKDRDITLAERNLVENPELSPEEREALIGSLANMNTEIQSYAEELANINNEYISVRGALESIPKPSEQQINARIQKLNARKEEVRQIMKNAEEALEERRLVEEKIRENPNIGEDDKARVLTAAEDVRMNLFKEDLAALSGELKTLEADKARLQSEEAEDAALKRESIIKIKSNIQSELDRLNQEMNKSDGDKEAAAAEIPLLNELLTTRSEKKLRDWDKQYQQKLSVMAALVDKPEGPTGSGSAVTPPSPAGGPPAGGSPPGPPPTPDGGGRPPPAPSDFPLYDSAVLLELREADERANKASKAIEAVREQLAAYAKKDEMTPEDIKMMEEKQKELMAKMEEFEEITKRVQHLVGLVDVASSQLGPPQKPMVPIVEGVRTHGPGQQTRPEDTLPKVIVCGTGDIDQVPKIIVCEPRKARDGKAPLYQQLEGKPKSKPGSADASGSGKKCPPPCQGAGGGGRPMPYNYPGFPPQGMSMVPPGMPGMYGPLMGGPQMGGPQMGGLPMGGLPMGGPQMGGPPMGGPQMGGPPGYMLRMPPGPPSMPIGLPPSIFNAVQTPCPCKMKKKSGKHADAETEVCSRELEQRLEASLNMSEMLADQNTKLEGSRYELQEAVLDKDKQHDALMLQLENLRLELQTVKNENKDLKNKVGGKEKGCLEGLQESGKKPGAGGLCKKELRTMPICKAQAYKEMGLPLPRNETRPRCPGAKFAVSMGWNENQGCRNELQKSVNCPPEQGGNQCPGQPGCVCSSKGQQACPAHKGCPAGSSGVKPQMMGSGDRAYNAQCPCGCLAPAGQCKRADMEAIVQTMEQEVKSLQNELELVQAERRGLALQKKLLNCMAEASGSPAGPTGFAAGGGGGGGGGGGPPNMMRSADNAGPPPNKPLVLLKKAMPDNLSAVELQLNSLREQYRKLQEDFNAKVEEVSMVRVEYEAAKRDALSLQDKCREAEARVDDLLERLRVIELEKTKMAGSKDQMVELEQQLTMAKQRYREGQEELEEIKTTMQDQMLQLEEYRNKYLSAQQTVEEQRRQIDIMELENNRISEQVNLEIQRVKNQFQEKLTELTPLPDMLKATQMKLQECDQLRQLAERNVEQLLNQSDELKDQNKKLESELEELRKHTATQAGEKESLTRGLTTGEKKIEEIKSENNKLRATVKRLEEVALNNDRRLDEKNHEVLQLQTQLETLREESARQVSRTKDRCEAVRRTLQGQISQLEFQLAQSRAAARTAQKDRDEIRQRMQAQITSLNDNFEQAQLRIRSLQSHVNYLKSSYTNIFAPEQNHNPMGPKPIDGLST